MLRLTPLGGLGEIGKNCMVLDDGARALMIDCGVTFKEQAFGVDVVHPDFAALEWIDRLVGVVLTHGHEDHVGALPYLLARHDVPVYGPPYALRVATERLREHDLHKVARLHALEPRRPQKIGSFEVEPIRVAHSVVDAMALFVRSSAGTVLHTGDFKFDARAPFGEDVDVERIVQVARKEGIDLLLSDSTNAQVAGATKPEVEVHEALDALIADAPGAVVVALFASNVARLDALGQSAVRHGRRVALLGRSMRLHLEAGADTGYLRWPDGLRVAPEHLQEIARDKLLLLATGSQGETRAALSRLAMNDHHEFRVAPGDRVILSSRVIPGHEPEVDQLCDALLRQGASVITARTHPTIHTSGHACQAEQQRMIELAEPRAFVPVHGGRQQLEAHARLARALGVERDLVVENGTPVLLEKDAFYTDVPFEIPVIRRAFGHEIPAEVIRERKRVAEHGQVLVVLRRDGRGALAGDPLVVLTGLAHGRAASALEGEVRRAVRRELTDYTDANDDSFTSAARYAARRAITAALSIKPESIARLLR